MKINSIKKLMVLGACCVMVIPSAFAEGSGDKAQEGTVEAENNPKKIFKGESDNYVWSWTDDTFTISRKTPIAEVANGVFVTTVSDKNDDGYGDIQISGGGAESYIRYGKHHDFDLNNLGENQGFKVTGSSAPQHIERDGNVYVKVAINGPDLIFTLPGTNRKAGEGIAHIIYDYAKLRDSDKEIIEEEELGGIDSVITIDRQVYVKVVSIGDIDDDGVIDYAFRTPDANGNPGNYHQMHSAKVQNQDDHYIMKKIYDFLGYFKF